MSGLIFLSFGAFLIAGCGFQGVGALSSVHPTNRLSSHTPERFVAWPPRPSLLVLGSMLRKEASYDGAVSRVRLYLLWEPSIATTPSDMRDGPALRCSHLLALMLHIARPRTPGPSLFA